MKLLFDQNLSPKLVKRLASLLPGSSHVQLVGLERASDEDVWHYALSNGFTIVTKDEDYADLAVLRGSPPKLIWLQLGNCQTSQVETVFLDHIDDILAFESDPSFSILVLS